jgi:hypothetical protein
MKKCYIYKISNNNDPTEFYIGSTLNLSRRKSHHKKNVKNKRGKLYWCKLYQYIRENGGWESFTFIKIHEMEVESMSQCVEEEQAIINMLKPTLNSIRSSKLTNPTTSFILSSESI